MNVYWASVVTQELGQILVLTASDVVSSLVDTESAEKMVKRRWIVVCEDGTRAPMRIPEDSRVQERRWCYQWLSRPWSSTGRVRQTLYQSLDCWSLGRWWTQSRGGTVPVSVASWGRKPEEFSLVTGYGCRLWKVNPRVNCIISTWLKGEMPLYMELICVHWSIWLYSGEEAWVFFY